MSSIGGFVDRNFRVVLAGTMDTDSETIDPGADNQVNDTLKLSRGAPITIENKTIVSHREDCVDGVGVMYGTFRGLNLVPRGKNGITLKGAACRNLFTGLIFHGHGSEADIELGQFDNYWYPGRPATKNNRFSGYGQADGSVVRVRLWDADDTNQFTFDTGAKIIRVPKFIWFPYFLFRYAQLRATNVFLRLSGQKQIVTSYAPNPA